jgi:cytochrome c-type biogenesis protein
MAFAFGWTPCLGPILAGILAYASTQQTATQGMLLLGTYSLGLGVPFLAMAVAMNACEGVLQRIKRHTRTLELVSGGLLVILGVLVYTGDLAEMASYASSLLGDARQGGAR